MEGSPKTSGYHTAAMFEGEPWLGVHDAEKRQYLGQLYAWLLQQQIIIVIQVNGTISTGIFFDKSFVRAILAKVAA